MNDNFDVIILIGRPAAGKSEVIDFLKKTPNIERSKRFHIGEFEEIDDFVYVWETFEIDDILTKNGKPRIWSDEKYWFKEHFVWNLYIERLSLTYRKKIAADANYHQKMTTVVEFARGGENGFAEAFSYLHEDLLKRAAIIYIKVPYEESFRKNRKRARPGMEDSILYHSLPDEKMEFYYKTNDWDKITSLDSNYIKIKGINVPYMAFENMPEKTDDPVKLGAELERITGKLWTIYKK
ncbi:MAG: hypothetical protein HY964_09340 [Ignavibacteriales bacterium]|nr:hypothetical protein [Ignavibacteriales bacterium]